MDPQKILDMIAMPCSSYRCEHCDFQFRSNDSLTVHKQIYCYKRIKLPRSCTVTSEMEAKALEESAGNQKDQVSSAMLQESVEQKRSDLEQLEEFKSIIDPFYTRGFEDIANAEHPARPPKRKRSEIDLLVAPVIPRGMAFVPECFANSGYISYANDFGVFDQDFGSNAFSASSFDPVDGIAENDYITVDSSPESQTSGQNLSASEMLYRFASRYMQKF